MFPRKKYAYCIVCTECKRSVNDSSFYEFHSNRVYAVFSSLKKAVNYLSTNYHDNLANGVRQLLCKDTLRLQFPADNSGFFIQFDYSISKYDIR